MSVRERLVWMAVSSFLSCGAALAQTCATPPSGMIAWWTLDETAGTIAKDSIGMEPAAYFGAPAPVQTPGQVAGALKFNGTTDFLSATDSSLWAFGTSNFTIELWANFTAPNGGSIGEPSDVLIGNDEGPDNRNKWFFALGGGNLYFHVNSPTLGPNFFPLVPFSPTLNQWYHLAVTKNGAIYTIYINGMVGGTATFNSPIPAPNAPLTIGQAESLGYMKGLLDEVSVYNRALSQAELQGIVSAGTAGKCKVAIPSAITPLTGGNAGQVTVTLSGSLLAGASAVQLTMSGQTAINGSTPIVSTNGTSLTTTFDLTGQPLGVWNVVVTTPGLVPVALPHSFTIESATPPDQVWVNIVGRGAIRVGETQEFTILYGNLSDTDAVDVPIWLKGIPLTATFTPQFNLTEPPTVAGFAPIDPSLPVTITTSNDIEVPLIIGRIPPGFIGSLQFSMKVANTSPIHLVATLSSPLASYEAGGTGAPAGSFSQRSRSSVRVSPEQGSGDTLSINTQAEQCLVDLGQLALQALGENQTANCASQILQSVTTGLTFLVNVFTPGLSTAEDYPLSLGSLGTSLEETGLACAKATVPPPVQTLLNAFDGALSVLGTVEDCTPVFSPTNQGVLDVIAVQSYDPNAKQGSQGVGAQQYLSGSSPWPYTIAFENEATASAPAQSVTVTDQLDTAHLDLTTFSLGPIGFGTQEIVPPPGLSQFATYVDLRPTTNVIVAVNASLNKTTGIVTWAFTSLDPSTGLAPSNPLVGFLPANVVPPQGDGQVLFSVSPKGSVSTGQQISNSASVVFDANPAVVTPAWSNMVDNSPPVSRVQALPAQSPASFTVSWQGSDVGSGVKDYTIYVSDNLGPFTAWQTDTISTQATYAGLPGNTYQFYSIARDLTNNIESSKVTAEATTTVPAPLQISTTSLPNATSGRSYTTTLAATGGSGIGYTWTISSGTLPAGFTLSSAGVLGSTGNPVAQANSYSFTVKVTDSASDFATQQLTLVITATPPQFTVSGQIAVSGVGLSGVIINVNGSTATSTTTNASGSYSISLPGSGTYTLSPALAGYSFSAPVTFSNLTANQTASFTGVAVAGLDFYPVTPCRVADTRTVAGFTGAFGSPSMAAGATRAFNVLSSQCATGVPATVAAYSLNFTVIPPAGGPESNLTAWPAGLAGMPNVSTLNYYGSVVANAAIVPAGSNGAINVFVVDPTDVVIDIDGYFAPPVSSGLEFYPVTPCRVADTRTGAGFTGQFGPPSLTAQQTRAFNLPASSCGIPATASAYSLNFTVVPPAGGPESNLTTWPASQSTMPNVSTLNYYGGVVANAAIVPAGTGTIDIYVVDPTNVLFDATGYFAPAQPSGLHFYPLAPCRIADTRAGAGFTGQFGPPSMAAGTTRTFTLPASSCEVPATASAYSLNFTVAPPAGGPESNLTTWPAGLATMPNVSTLNYYGTVVANAAIVPAGTNGAINVFVVDPTDVIIDVDGYFAP